MGIVALAVRAQLARNKKVKLTKNEIKQIIKEELNAVMESYDDERAMADKMLARMRSEPMDDSPSDDDAGFNEEDHDNDIFSAANLFRTHDGYSMDDFIEDISVMTGFKLSRGRAKQVYDWANERIGPLDPQ